MFRTLGHGSVAIKLLSRVYNVRVKFVLFKLEFSETSSLDIIAGFFVDIFSPARNIFRSFFSARRRKTRRVVLGSFGRSGLRPRPKLEMVMRMIMGMGTRTRTCARTRMRIVIRLRMRLRLRMRMHRIKTWHRHLSREQRWQC